MATEIIRRCSTCAFDNPEESLYCGMCGSRLAEAYPQYKKNRKKKETYIKSILRGTISDAADYGRAVWSREIYRLIGLMLLIILFFLLPAIITAASWENEGARVFWIAWDVILLSFIFAASCSGFLDAVRERRLEFWRSIASGFRSFFPALMLLVLLVIVIGAVTGIVWLWMIPVRYLDSSESIFSEGTGSLVILAWMIGLLVVLLLPMYIWLVIGSTLAMCRIVDRKSSVWTAPAWALKQIFTYHWQLFKIGLGQVFSNVLGLIMCYVGILGTIPLTGVAITSVYEWLRLRGPESDPY